MTTQRHSSGVASITIVYILGCAVFAVGGVMVLFFVAVQHIIYDISFIYMNIWQNLNMNVQYYSIYGVS